MQNKVRREHGNWRCGESNSTKYFLRKFPKLTTYITSDAILSKFVNIVFEGINTSRTFYIFGEFIPKKHNSFTKKICTFKIFIVSPRKALKNSGALSTM